MAKLRRMKKNPPKKPATQFWTIFLWLFSFIMFLELLTRKITNSPDINLFSFGLLTATFFSLSTTFFILTFIYLSHEKYHYIYAVLAMFLIFILFSSQLIYHDIFRTFYFFQSIEYIKQGLGFKEVILSVLTRNLWWIIFSLAFLIIYVTLEVRKRKIYLNNRFSWKMRISFSCPFLALFLLFHYLGIWNIKGHERSKEVYFNIHASNYSVEMLGLMTTFRLDVQRSLTNWEPPKVKKPSNKIIPAASIPPLNTNEIYHQQEEKIEFNKLDIPFDRLIAESKNEDIKQLHQYFQQKQPSNKNEFTGKYEGYNLIWITAEAYAPYAVRKDLTPTLYKLSREGYQFNNFYNPLWGVSTSDGEYTILNSLVPKPGVWSFSKSSSNNVPFTMGNLLKKLNYETKAYHNHTYDYYDRHLSHPNLGYDYKGVGNGLNMEQMWPRSDLEMIEKTVDEYINQEPFHVYYMTVSGHLEYNFIGNQIAQKNRSYVDHLDLSDEAKAYLAGQIELDKALETLINRLDEENIFDQTLIVMTGDHYPYGLSNETIEELTGKPLDEKFDIYKNEWILYATNMKKKIAVDEPTSPLDMLPTISNLMGLDFDSRFLMGRDVFSNEDPLVVFNDKSFITEDFKYYYPEDKVIPLQNKEINLEHLERMKQKTEEIFYYSMKILDLDYYNHLNLDHKQKD